MKRYDDAIKNFDKASELKPDNADAFYNRGLAPIMVKELFKFVKILNDQGIKILLVEQNIRHALDVADRAYLLANGRIIIEGSRELFLDSDHLKKAYLGL